MNVCYEPKQTFGAVAIYVYLRGLSGQESVPSDCEIRAVIYFGGNKVISNRTILMAELLNHFPVSFYQQER